MTNDGGPAFPFPSGPEPRVDEFHDRCDGMSLRDWIAAKAMQGICAIPTSANMEVASISKSAYLMADAMLAAREGQVKP